MSLLSFAERQALEATRLEPFSVQLHDVRRSVEQILNLFGREGMFSEYTVHNFSHVEAMLDDLDWLLTKDVKDGMTSGDWLMVTLAIYFHDIGLVVTEEEFARRQDSGFPAFCRDVLFSRADGQDYENKVRQLGPEKAERFFYQEFVRANHAKRVRAWIEGTHFTQYGFSHAQVSELKDLLGRMDLEFRKDLAIVCESHNLDDLDNLNKYKPFQPYGRNRQESVNILFCAVVLRAVDLLQFTKQRAPSVMFRMINPTDPVSQAEWIKQNCVRGIFKKPTANSDGNIDIDLPSETISVHAKFTDQNGFFGITSYLRYAEKQLKYASESLNRGNATIGSKLYFPWRRIDTSNIEPVGFIPTPFEFSIDQSKILDLLTGHTLYNDSSVALRELMQNSIDAVRLYFQKSDKSSFAEGEIQVSWDSSTQKLTIKDNGTGMTQDIIERHLLSVGSSRYQDQKFKDSYPAFNSISRFGIGVLSAFMVADDVQIVTFNEEEDEGREITLRSVHGQYLVRLLKKNETDESREVGAHGTKVTLRLRASARESFDVLDTLRTWILFPRCKVTALIDESPAVEIGFLSPKHAIQSYVDTNPVLSLKKNLIEVCEVAEEGMSIAFALVYNQHFRDKTFATISESQSRNVGATTPVGLCVEGIRVELEPPGFSRGSGFLAVSDHIGRSAPKTNVARSSLESHTDRANLADKAFTIYMRAVQSEIDRLQAEESYSLNYAVSQFPYIIGPLSSASTSTSARTKAFEHFPQFLIEDKDTRKVVSASELAERGGFWTVESKPVKSLIELLKDAPASVTCQQVSKFCQFKGDPLPAEGLVINVDGSSITRGLLKQEFEIVHINGYIEDRRLDVLWRPKEKKQERWYSNNQIMNDYDLAESDALTAYARYRESRRRSPWHSAVWIPRSDVNVAGLEGYCSVNNFSEYYLLPDVPITQFLSQLDWRSSPGARLHLMLFIDSLFPAADTRRKSLTQLYADEIEYTLKELVARFGDDLIDTHSFLDAIKKSESRLSIFDPWSWSRDEDENEFYDYPF